MAEAQMQQDDPLQKTPDGRWVATIDLGDGSPVQKFYGDTREEVIRQLIKAQTHATKTIREQKKALKLERPDPVNKVSEFKPRDLTPEEKFKLTAEISDPTKSAEAIRRLIEAELGGSIDEVREALNAVKIAKERERIIAEAQEFLARHPEFKQCPENDKLMTEYLEARNMGYTARNLEIAFEDLKDVLILNRPESQTATVIRPRLASTGIPASASSGRSTGKKVGLTVEEINRMPLEEYRKRLVSDPEFVRQVNEALSQRSSRPAR